MSGRPRTSTLIISGLLLLALAFAGYWIVYYAEGEGAPWSLLPWFGLAAAVIIVCKTIGRPREGSARAPCACAGSARAVSVSAGASPSA